VDQDLERMAEQWRELIRLAGDDPDRDGLRRTPRRAAEALRYLTCGYRADLDRVINGAVFPAESDDMVIVRNIELYSLCEHHLLPFFGRCHVAYIPAGRMVGLSKIPRLVDVLSRRLQVQERMTRQIANVLDDALQPQGVAVVVEATHMCMVMRGAAKANCTVVTSAVLGAFRAEGQARSEFMGLLRSRP
jgi:GTP cyclohydrolase I